MPCSAWQLGDWHLRRKPECDIGRGNVPTANARVGIIGDNVGYTKPGMAWYCSYASAAAPIRPSRPVTAELSRGLVGTMAGSEVVLKRPMPGAPMRLSRACASMRTSDVGISVAL